MLAHELASSTFRYAFQVPVACRKSPVRSHWLPQLQAALDTKLGLFLISPDRPIRFGRLRESPNTADFRRVEIEEHLAGNRLHPLPRDVDHNGAPIGEDLQLREGRRDTREL